MRYAAAFCVERNRREAFRLYLAEAARCVSESCARYAGGPYLTVKWADVINPKPTEARTPEEVVGHMKKVLGAG